MRQLFRWFTLLQDVARLLHLTGAQYQLAEDSRPRQLQNLTDTYAPLIKRDFPEFNATTFLTQAEHVLTALISGIDKGNIDSDLPLTPALRSRLEETLALSQRQGTHLTYHDFSISKSAISKYRKTSGHLEIHMQLAVAYRTDTLADTPPEQHKCYLTALYLKPAKANVQNGFTHYQCPNCGAPITDDSRTCRYCNSFLEAHQHRVWLFDAYRFE